MTAAAPANVTGAVAAAAQQYGVPQGIWQDVAYVESGYNVRAVGDNGTSFGLFQLHVGGQADRALAAGYSTDQLLDPKVNAQFAMPAIASAWNNLKSSFNPNDISWWKQFAAQSGHPGGSPGNSTTDAEAARLMANYSSNGGDPTLQGIVTGAITSATGSVPAGVASGDAAANVSNIFANLPGAMIRIGLFLAALLLIIVGFWVVSQ